ncbi:MAG: phage tail family protein [Clostridia bacterium]|nr:phage tail family protein [Clostridia bacterium]
MNYIIWKGKNSTEINGLLVSELPVISRPKIKTSIIEIEGKDGDIVDNMGYSAYDKDLKIGLFGDYDIDEISKYFSGSGEVIFSNEPDKYYRAEIFEEIDFERLVNFKTASVKFHTQPYKYLVNEETSSFNISEGVTQVEVNNVGLKPSKPIITLYGTGTVEIKINALGELHVDIGDEGYLTVDSMLEECYKDTTLTLKNRAMGGEFPILSAGKNVITWTGNLIKIEIKPMSRWL